MSIYTSTKLYIYLLIIGLGLMLVGLLMDIPLKNKILTWQTSYEISSINAKIIDRSQQLKEVMLTSTSISVKEFTAKQVEINVKAKQNHIELFIYDDNSLLYWTTYLYAPRRVSPFNVVVLEKVGKSYYLQLCSQHNGFVYIASSPLQTGYTIDNDYLYNKNDIINIREWRISQSDSVKSNLNLKLGNQNVAKLIRRNQNKNLLATLFVFIPGWLAFGFSCLRLIQLCIRRRRTANTLIFIIAFFGLNIFLWKFARLPENLYSLPLFSAKYYAGSSLMNSLGDACILSILLLIFSNILIRSSKFFSSSSRNNIIQLALYGLVGSLLASQFIPFLESLVLDSSFSMALDNVLSLNIYSIIAILLSGLWLYILFRLGSQYILVWLRSGIRIYMLILTLLPGLLISVFLVDFHYLEWFSGVLLLLVVLTSIYFYFKASSSTKPWLYAVQVMLSAAFISIHIANYQNENREEDAQILANNVQKERDAVAEYLININSLRMINDGALRQMVRNETPKLNQKISRRMQQTYFTGYLNKYIVTAYHEHLPDDFKSADSTYKNLLLNNPLFQGTDYEILQPHRLYFVNQHNGLPTYFYTFILYNVGPQPIAVSLNIREKPFYEASVYPELLLSTGLQQANDQNNFSYAIYNSNKLITQHGEYNYPRDWTLKGDKSKNAVWQRVLNNGKEHFIINIPEANQKIIISASIRGLFYYISLFTAILVFYSTLILSILLIRRIRHSKYNRLLNRSIIGSWWSNISFRNKILFTILFGLSIALILMGYVTVEYINYQYNKEEITTLQYKTRSIQTRLENAINNTESDVPVTLDEIATQISSLSDDHQTDVNLYNTDGYLLASSQQLIFDRNLLSQYINPEAYTHFANDYSSQVIVSEHLGDLQYLSSYVPIRNYDGVIVAFINLPYFSKEQSLEQRINNFLVALINVYILLFFLLLLMGVLLSRALVSPLNTIRERLRATGLSGSNFTLNWDTNDEIGLLVKEYNLMVKKLNVSAEKLAQSEREGAWKEMARQVAHEIKNPLTPMKLKLQQMQLIQKSGQTNIAELWDRTAKLLITQIDTLNEIAVEFSEFATMPMGHPIPIDVNNNIRQLAELYADSTEAKIQLKLSEETPVILIDSSQFDRSITNLIKNAMQSIPANRDGVVQIESFIYRNRVQIVVSDNGNGIPEELHKRIFTPNFSTKNSGMGLGLTMVRNIIERQGGNIKFETVQGEGTSFYISMPYHFVS
ncbi:MAG: ATP-binding protein [Bacteroidota bacterium]|nr:ATP-binding protein [Bacteroidota bacterium]